MSVSKPKVDKPTPNYMIIEGDFSYNKKILLPYEDGMSFIQALKHAEILNKGYSIESSIREFQTDDLNIRLMGAQEYGEIKLKSIFVPEE